MISVNKKVASLFTLLLILLLVVTLLLVALPKTVFAEMNPTLQRDLDLMFEWFPGRYDNATQIVMQERNGTPKEERNYRRHSIFRRVNLPVFGEHVIYAEQYRDGDPTNIYRLRIYELTIDTVENAIRLRVHVPKQTEPLEGAYSKPHLLSQLTPDDTVVWDGCDLFWERREADFIGRLKEGACRFYSENFEQDIWLNEYLILKKDALWFADQGVDKNGDYLFGMKGGSAAKALKVRPFECAASVLNASKNTISDQSSRERDSYQNIWLHDQGGTALLKTQYANIPDVSLLLHRIRSEQDGAHSTLNLSVYNAANLELLAETREDYSDEQISIDLPRLSVHCAYSPERVYQDGR